MTEVSIMEVGPRDGLQNERAIVDTSSKLAFIEGLCEAGLKRVEISAFVSPKWIPPLADHLEIARRVTKHAGVVFAALVPNMQGYEKAVEAGIDEVAFVIAASEKHNKKNINATTSEAFTRYAEVAARALSDKIPFRAYVSCAFGCPYEGEIAQDVVVELALKLKKLGAYQLSIGDTIGVANPVQTASLVEAISRKIPLADIALHMHDTRGLALANIFAALQKGVTAFDSSAGGMGGCPYAPGASGNVATEDLVFMLHSMGYSTGINVEKLAELSLQMEKILGHALPAKMLAVCRANEPKQR